MPTQSNYDSIFKAGYLQALQDVLEAMKHSHIPPYNSAFKWVEEQIAEIKTVRQ